MFKQGSVADEISLSMERELLSRQSEKQHGFSKIVRAAELLNAAASLFAQADMQEEALEITGVLEKLAHQLEKP